MEEKGLNEGVEVPKVSSAGKCHEIASIVGGESVFVYGNVLTENPEDLASSSSGDSGYDWASRDISDFCSLFKNRVVLEDWVDNSCILRTLGYKSCIKLVACRENERVFHGRESVAQDFFYFYSSLFYYMYIRLPLSVFQMEVLKTLNVASTRLHPNSWGYIQAFVVVCQALAIRPTTPLFLHFFRCRPIAKRGWVSLISEPGDALLKQYSQSYRGFKDKFFRASILDSGQAFFFHEDGIPKFSLYWTQNPLKFTSWPEDKMTVGELEALKIMGKKGPVRNWFKAIASAKAGSGCPGPSLGTTQLPPNVWSSFPDEVAIVEETEGHKIDFNLDDSEKKVVESMTEQQMADAMLELTSRAAMAAWHMAYASDRGVLRVELQKAQTQLKELADTAGFVMKREQDQLQRERDQLATELEQSTKTVAALTKESDGLLLAAAEEKEIREEMSEAIIVEHIKGFKKALRQVTHLLQVSTEGVEFDLRKDVYEGQLVPLVEIPDDAFMEPEEGNDVGVAAVEGPNAEAIGGFVAGVTRCCNRLDCNVLAWP
ncbi:hypothetical protein LR48_Vigan07g177900 [Vigna angularis]|uniref:Transposase (putative) gypsy type domain-containing protein n=1 Tax=Phaseolus angularis TaxID=3914 RepID=A0A0L9UYZ5_PHAAN|nr:hypothetical protein LR48_Vigan07g177900 [Vigna angularis]